LRKQDRWRESCGGAWSCLLNPVEIDLEVIVEGRDGDPLVREENKVF
jgi:hypothetical protein